MGNCCDREKMIINAEVILEESKRLLKRWEVILAENPEFRNSKTFMYYGHTIDTFYIRSLNLQVLPTSIKERYEKLLYETEQLLETITRRMKRGAPDINIPWDVEKYCRQNPDWKKFKSKLNSEIQTISET